MRIFVESPFCLLIQDHHESTGKMERALFDSTVVMIFVIFFMMFFVTIFMSLLNLGPVVFDVFPLAPLDPQVSFKHDSFRTHCHIGQLDLISCSHCIGTIGAHQSKASQCLRETAFSALGPIT